MDEDIRLLNYVEQMIKLEVFSELGFGGLRNYLREKIYEKNNNRI